MQYVTLFGKTLVSHIATTVAAASRAAMRRYAFSTSSKPIVNGHWSRGPGKCSANKAATREGKSAFSHAIVSNVDRHSLVWERFALSQRRTDGLPLLSTPCSTPNVDITLQHPSTYPGSYNLELGINLVHGHKGSLGEAQLFLSIGLLRHLCENRLLFWVCGRAAQREQAVDVRVVPGEV